MGRGVKLNESEIKTILTLKKENMSVSKISKILKKSRNVIMNLLKDPENYGKKKSTGRPRAVSLRGTRAILREASNSKLTARQIAINAGVNTNVRNVQRILQQSQYIERKKLKRKPLLTMQHIEARLTFAREHIRWVQTWKKVIFTDEKRFTLDGPDGWSYYFHDLRKDPIIQTRRQQKGGGVMVWAAIGFHGKTDIKFINKKLNSRGYIELIDEEIKAHARRISGDFFIFQQDNAAVYTAKAVKDYFNVNNITVLPWPARSPDLNIIENVWAQLVRTMYQGGKQFNSINELKVAIEEGWQSISETFIKTLYKSLPKRMLEVVENRGKHTHY